MKRLEYFMKASSALVLLGMVTATSAAACVTVNIYFPAPAVRAAAEEIVEETWGEGVQPPAPAEGTTAPDGGSSAEPDRDAALRDAHASASRASSSAVMLLALLGPRDAYAAEQPDINVSTAAIRALKDAMKTRAGQLKPYLAAGNVGLANTGMLVVRDTSGLNLGTQATIRRLVEAENRDRQALYAAIAEANNIGADRVADIQKIFAETWVDKAEAGWPIQKSDGSWTKK